jgi:predicted nuclease with TOPRIM domain
MKLSTLRQFHIIRTVMTFLQRLRTENRLLRQRVELLEAESSELADRLVRGQVSRAEEEETTFVVQRELAALRHTHLETSHQLEIAHEEIRNLSLLMEETVSFELFVILLCVLCSLWASSRLLF